MPAISTRTSASRHRDPFDRLLVAQGRQEGFTLVTVDTRIHACDVTVFDPLA